MDGGQIHNHNRYQVHLNVKKTVIIGLLFVTGQVLAATGYITDRLEITLRSGQSTQHQILRMLPSGAAVDVLETDEESGYSKVRTGDGVEGWVLSRYLEKEPGAREQLAGIRTRLAAARQENQDLSQKVSKLESEKRSLDKDRQNLQQEQQRINRELDHVKTISSKPLEVDQENRGLKERLIHMEQQTQTYQQEIARLKDRTARDWFIIGAGVILLGMVIGLIIPKIRWRKKSSWGSL